jgi:hypothetical protein
MDGSTINKPDFSPVAEPLLANSAFIATSL